MAIYVANNGKGWAIFKDNPTHPHKRPYAFIESSKEWSLVAATYYQSKEKAEVIAMTQSGNADLIGKKYIDEGPYFKGAEVEIVSISKTKPLTHVNAKLFDMTWEMEATEVRKILEEQSK